MVKQPIRWDKVNKRIKLPIHWDKVHKRVKGNLHHTCGFPFTLSYSHMQYIKPNTKIQVFWLNQERLKYSISFILIAPLLDWPTIEGFPFISMQLASFSIIVKDFATSPISENKKR